MNRKLCLFVCLCALLALCLGCANLKDAVTEAAQTDAGGQPAAEAEETQAPTRLDQRGAGLTDGDLAALAGQTQLTELDLRDNQLSPEAVAELQAALPGCAILWSIPVGSQRFDSDSDSLTLPADTDAAGLERLSLFPALASVDASACTDAAALGEAAEKLPGVAFTWNITVCGQAYPSGTDSLDLSKAPLGDVAALAEALQSFPGLKTVDLSGQELDFSAMDTLSAACPDTAFTWGFTLYGVPVTSDMTELDLSGKKIENVDELLDKLRYLPHLTKLDLCDCGPTNEEMEKLMAAYPSVKFVWMIQVGGWEMRTDVKAFSKGNRHHFEGGRYTGGKTNFGNDDIQPLKYCTDLIALDLGHGNRITDLSILQYLPKLRFLIVAMNDISDISALAYCPELEYVETFQNDISDWTPFLSLPKLTHLNCSTNFGKSDGGDKVYPDYKLLMQMPQLQRLWIIRCGITDEQLAELKAALPDCVICTTGTHSTSNDWRANDLYREMQDLFSLPYSD